MGRPLSHLGPMAPRSAGELGVPGDALELGVWSAPLRSWLPHSSLDEHCESSSWRPLPGQVLPGSREPVLSLALNARGQDTGELV